MTREEARKAADVMLAYANGEEIERLREDGYEWVEDNFNPLFNWFANEYRIKPKPTYRPFKTKEECWKEMMKHHPFCWITGSIEYHSISSISDVHILLDEKSYFTFEEAFNNFNFADGEPFGIKEE